MNYAERIRVLREDHDKTRSEIAGLLKVGQRTCCDYEHGKTRIPVDSLILLAEFYDVSMDYICGVSDIRVPFPKQNTVQCIRNLWTHLFQTIENTDV